MTENQLQLQLEVNLSTAREQAEQAREDLTEQLETLQLQLETELQNLREGGEADLADLSRRLNRARELQDTLSRREGARQQLEELEELL